ncbi:MAG TPA: Tm-1-like ATP-binding domain-containing protein, partial [Acidobacteriaceae bacterium]|nr:Tm-1-like ATP-binding domain-containing protein [Acidobacteriaceae bacterium]
TVPSRFRSRNLYIHNPTVTLMRTTAAECAEIGRRTALRLNPAAGPVTVLIPLQGVSAIDRSGGPFYSPEALSAYCQSLKAALSPAIRLVELDLHINDPSFASAAAGLLMESIGAGKRGMPQG